MNQNKFIAIPKDWEVVEIIKYLRKNKNVPQEFSNIVVVDEYLDQYQQYLLEVF